MSEKKYYCFCGANCKYETLNKEQILSAIAQAQSGMPVIDPDAGVLTKVRETNTGGYITFWVGTQAQYNALQGNVEQNCFYIITDETTGEDIEDSIAALTERVSDLESVGKRVSIYSPKITIDTAAATLQLADSDLTIQYAPAARAAFLRGFLSIRGHISAGETVKFHVKKVPLRFADAVYPDALSCYNDDGDTKAGRLEACCKNGSSAGEKCVDIVLRAKEEFESASPVNVIVSGFYFTDGEV